MANSKKSAKAPRHKPDRIDEAAYFICDQVYRSCDCYEAARAPCPQMTEIAEAVEAILAGRAELGEDM